MMIVKTVDSTTMKSQYNDTTIVENETYDDEISKERR